MRRRAALNKKEADSHVVRRIGVLALRGVIIVLLGLILAIFRVSRIESIPSETGWRITKTRVGYKFG
ncbi:MAG: hypothetical protein JXJ17_14265 [Anaerolineae bacterium]|nr:hypothetical protein [Anaerolineae bacterium]